MIKMQILAKNPPPNPLVLREGESKELPRTREESNAREREIMSFNTPRAKGGGKYSSLRAVWIF